MSVAMFMRQIPLSMHIKILSRASEAGSPRNRSGSDKTRGQGSFGLSTGGPDLQGSLQPAELTKLDNHLDKKLDKYSLDFETKLDF